MWEVEERKKIATLMGHTEGISHLALSPDGKLLCSAGYDHTIRVWNLTDRKEIANFPEKDEITDIHLIRNGHICILLTFSNEVKLWSLTEKQQTITLTGHTETIKGIAVFNCEKFCFTCSMDHTIRMWDLNSGEEIMAFTGENATADHLKLTEDNLHFKVQVRMEGWTFGVWRGK